MFYRVRQIRSTVGLPKLMKERCYALGLRRRGGVVYHRVNPSIAGQIMSIKELVNVQLVDNQLTQAEERLLRKPPIGFTIEKEQD